jgi:hypothetical protein
MGHGFKGGKRLKGTIPSRTYSNGTMGHGFEGGRRLNDLDVVVHRVMGQWDTVKKGGGD